MVGGLQRIDDVRRTQAIQAAIGVHHPRRLAVALAGADHFGQVVLVEPGNALASRARTPQLLVDALHRRRPVGTGQAVAGVQEQRAAMVEQFDVGPQATGPQLRRQGLVVLLGAVAGSIPLEQFRVRRRADAVLPDLHVDARGRTEAQRSAGHTGRIDAGGRQVGRHHHRPGGRCRLQCGDDRAVEGRALGRHLRGLIGDVPAGECWMRRVLLGQLRHRLRGILRHRCGIRSLPERRTLARTVGGADHDFHPTRFGGVQHRAQLGREAGDPFEILRTAGTAHASPGGAGLADDERVIAQILQLVEEHRQLCRRQLLIAGRIAEVDETAAQQCVVRVRRRSAGQQGEPSKSVHGVPSWPDIHPACGLHPSKAALTRRPVARP